jgi:predicted TIM-barrel fold metal-dependent hydrolase
MRLILAIAVPAAILAQTNAESNGELLLRDFHPKTRLEVKQTQIVHAKFPVIDVHFHMDPANDPAKVAQTMNQLNLQVVVNLGNHDMWGEALRSYVAKWVKPYPSRFAVMANIDPKMINDPDFGAKAVAQLKEDVRNGGIAWKIYKGLGLVSRNTNGKLIRPDDARCDPVWDACANLDIPVLIHVNDTMPFFDPIDRYNEAISFSHARPAIFLVRQGGRHARTAHADVRANHRETPADHFPQHPRGHALRAPLHGRALAGHVSEPLL